MPNHLPRSPIAALHCPGITSPPRWRAACFLARQVERMGSIQPSRALRWLLLACLSTGCDDDGRDALANPCPPGPGTAAAPGTACAPTPMPVATCSDTSFACGDGECIERSARCDGELHCADGSDEDTCEGDPGSECAAGEFACHDGACIPDSWRCDGLQEDCRGGEDEQQCGPDADPPGPSDPPGHCNAGQWACGDGTCIPEAWRCDGNDDCDDDELNCGAPPTCAADQWTCGDGSCIPAAAACDGASDCPGGDDELDCGPPATCAANEWACDDGACIPGNWRCDGMYDDCTGGEDELSCDTCPEGEWACFDGTCITATWVCDGRYSDCASGEDEASC